MRDLAFLGFIGALLVLGLKRPFLFTLLYAYVDIVSPQRLSYFLLNRVPISMIAAGLAIGGWLIADRKRLTFGPRQGLMLILFAYAGVTTLYADFPIDALDKWDWASKAVGFAIFLPFVLSTRLRIEALLLFMMLSLGAIVIVGGIKTALSGGGYGALNLMVSNNSGLYEGSILSTFAIASIPVILWFARFGTIFPSDWRVKVFCYALCSACLLIPIGTEARTGLLCIVLLGLLMLRDLKLKQRILFAAAAGALGLAAIPFLPSSFTERMETIQGYQADESAGTRLAVWGWTLTYVRDNPWGGGFEAYRQNRINVRTVDSREAGDVTIVSSRLQEDQGRAWHSAYFEMLGEQGWPGLILFLLIHGIGLVRMEMIRRRWRKAEGDDAWIAPLATAMQHFQLIFLLGAVFVAVAFQAFIWLMIGVQIAFDFWLSRREKAKRVTAYRGGDGTKLEGEAFAGR